MQNSELFLKSIPQKVLQNCFFYNPFDGMRHGNILEELVFPLTTLATNENLNNLSNFR